MTSSFTNNSSIENFNPLLNNEKIGNYLSHKTIRNKSNKNKYPIKLIEIVEEIDTNAYCEMRRPYLNSNYIPSNIIPTIMRHFFYSNELLFSYNENHGIYKIMVKDLLIDSIINWEHNRPPDMARCPDIARYIYNSKKQIDTVIYLNFNNRTETFEVLDGIHRITALKIIKEYNSQQLDLITQGDFGSANDAQWLYNQYIIVNIRFNATKGELIETFETLNKSIPVSELYICDHNKEKKEDIENIINDWYFKYKNHFSSSVNPQTGNTNRTKFENLLVYLYEKHKIRHSNIDKLRRLLDEANHKISNNISSKVSINIRVRCKESGCYLFLLKNDILEEYI